MEEIEELRKQAYMIINNIAFMFKKNEHNTLFRQVVDVDNVEYKAKFRLVNDDFELVSSTFSESKRKYEMLYYIEKNKELLLEECKDAQVF